MNRCVTNYPVITFTLSLTLMKWNTSFKVINIINNTENKFHNTNKF